MQKLSVYLLILALLLHCPGAFSADTAPSKDTPACMNDANENNLKLYKSFKDNADPLKKAFLQEMASGAKGPACEPPPGSPTSSGKQTTDLKKIAHATNAQPEDTGIWDLDDRLKTPDQLPALIKRECINASLMRDPGQKGYACTANKKSTDQDIEISYGQVGGKTQQCITGDMVSYIQFAVNSAIKCLSPDNPVDARVIYQKFNNETGFNYSIAWNGGAGIGQMTNIAVEEIAEGNGKGILEGVAKSSKHSCQPFKDIAKSDLAKRPRITPNNYCDFVSAGDGLGRNLMYGIAYYLHMRDAVIEPQLFQENKSFAKNREIVSALTAVSYGAEGIKKARALAEKAGLYTEKNNPCKKQKISADKCYLQMVQKSSVYLKAIRGKMGETYCLKDGIEPSSKECTQKKAAMTDKQLGANECVKPL
ncbi:hypothetical protein ACLSU7_01470 [Bdellovibrio sp. HCB185ZH]|uniref:hypothetical protein n=1 Tax=Bdellovibrio sp. HCB185ZH TaxID=3394235 RepID=UPI0039A6A3AE